MTVYDKIVENPRIRWSILGTLAGVFLVGGAVGDCHDSKLKERLDETYSMKMLGEIHTEDSGRNSVMWVNSGKEIDWEEWEGEMGSAYDLEKRVEDVGKDPGRRAYEISRKGIEMIKGFEGFRSNPYRCPSGIKTVGYGHVIKKDEQIERVSRSEAEEILEKDVDHAENAVREYVTVPLNGNQVDALTSFVYNVGSDAFRRSTLLKKTNSKEFREARAEFARWNKSKGKVLKGLIKRRSKEAELFGRN